MGKNVLHSFLHSSLHLNSRFSADSVVPSYISLVSLKSPHFPNPSRTHAYTVVIGAGQAPQLYWSTKFSSSGSPFYTMNNIQPIKIDT